MVRTLAPHEAEALIAAGDVDVVDVREPHEYAAGHIASSRNVPLAGLKADVKAALPRDGVLLICARGMRSESAALAAEAAGRKEIYHLDGGTQGWQAAGLPLEQPSNAGPDTAPPAAASSCGLPPPGLDAVVGANMRDLRRQRRMTLDELARKTGLSRTLLGQIELGKTPPSVSTVWQIAQAFDVHFSALLASGERLETHILRASQAKRLASPDGRFASRALFPFSDKPDTEFYELFLAAHSREDARPHHPGTREHLIVSTGRLEITVGNERFDLGKGDAIVFTADVPHSYNNPGPDDCWLYLVMIYAAGEHPDRQPSSP